MALYHLHPVQSRFMAMEIDHAIRLCPVFHCLFLSLLAPTLRCIPGSSSSVSVGRKADVLTVCCLEKHVLLLRPVSWFSCTDRLHFTGHTQRVLGYTSPPLSFISICTLVYISIYHTSVTQRL